MTFDDVATGETPEDWTVADGASFTAMAMPTAVDRSAMLTADGATLACRASGELRSVAATLMVDALPAAKLELVRIGSVPALVLAPDGGVAAGSTTVATLAPGTWYEVAIDIAPGTVSVALLAPDGATTRNAELPLQEVPTKFCVGTEAGTRVFLDHLTLEYEP
jgi:hypothetical protein